MPSTKSRVSLMLLENVYNLGIVGDVVEVKPGYARNYLIPMGLATLPTEGARKAVEQRRAEVERQMRELREHRETMIAKLDGFEITLMRAANEQGVLFGSVSQHDIAEALQEEGFNITEREVRLGDPIKHHDSYMVPIQLDTDLRTEIKVWVVSDKPAEELMSEAVAEAESEQVAEDAEAELVEQPPRDLNA